MSKFIKAAAGLAIATFMGSAAQAGTQGHYTCQAAPPPPPPCVSCKGPKTGTSTLPPLSSYFEHQRRCVVKTVVHVPPPVVHHVPPRDDCKIIVHRPKRHCYVVVKPPVVKPPVIHPPVIHPPVIRPPIYRPPVVIRPPVVYRPVVRPIVSVPYPVPYPVYTGCGYNPCPPVKRYSRYGS